MRIDIRKYTPSPETGGLINLLYDKDRELERVRTDVLDYKTEILRNNYWKNEAEVEQYRTIGVKVEEHIITDPEHIFLLSTDNLKKFKTLCYHAALRRGYKVRGIEDCPLIKCDNERAVLRDRLVQRLIYELEDQRIISLRNLRAVSGRAYTDHIENLIHDLLEEVATRRKLREVRALEIESEQRKQRQAL